MWISFGGWLVLQMRPCGIWEGACIWELVVLGSYINLTAGINCIQQIILVSSVAQLANLFSGKILHIATYFYALILLLIDNLFFPGTLCFYKIYHLYFHHFRERHCILSFLINKFVLKSYWLIPFKTLMISGKK